MVDGFHKRHRIDAIVAERSVPIGMSRGIFNNPRPDALTRKSRPTFTMGA